MLAFSVGEPGKHSLHNRTFSLGLENVLLMFSECSYLVQIKITKWEPYAKVRGKFPDNRLVAFSAG